MARDTHNHTQDIWCHVRIHNWIHSYAKRATNLFHNLFCNEFSYLWMPVTVCTQRISLRLSTIYCEKFDIRRSFILLAIVYMFRYLYDCKWYLRWMVSIVLRIRCENILHLLLFSIRNWCIQISLVCSSACVHNNILVLGAGFCLGSTLNTEHPRRCRDFILGRRTHTHTVANSLLNWRCSWWYCCCCGCYHSAAVFHNFCAVKCVSSGLILHDHNQ